MTPLYSPVSPGVYDERLAIVLGFLALVSGIATFLTCRTTVSLMNRFRMTAILKNRVFLFLFRMHPYIWWFFWLIIALHLMSAVMHTLGLLFGPEAGIHLLILGLATAVLVLLVILLCTCRSTSFIFANLAQGKTRSGRLFRWLYQHHSWFWLLLALSLAGHIMAAYSHAGIWPQAV